MISTILTETGTFFLGNPGSTCSGSRNRQDQRFSTAQYLWLVIYLTAFNCEIKTILSIMYYDDNLLMLLHYLSVWKHRQWQPTRGELSHRTTTNPLLELPQCDLSYPPIPIKLHPLPLRHNKVRDDIIFCNLVWDMDVGVLSLSFVVNYWATTQQAAKLELLSER